MQFQTTIEVAAPADVLWQAVADVEHWPEWTPTMNEVTWLTAMPAASPTGALVPGGQARIRQPGLPELVWEVTDVRPGESFTWRTATAGVTATAVHEIRPLPGERAELTLGLAQAGPLARIVGLLSSRRTRQALQQEAEGLKRCAEVAATTPPPPR